MLHVQTKAWLGKATPAEPNEFTTRLGKIRKVVGLWLFTVDSRSTAERPSYTYIGAQVWGEHAQEFCNLPAGKCIELVGELRRNRYTRGDGTEADSYRIEVKQYKLSDEPAPARVVVQSDAQPISG